MSATMNIYTILQNGFVLINKEEKEEEEEKDRDRAKKYAC